MKRTLIISREAEADIQSAFNWYEEHQARLGEEFLRVVDTLFAEIEHRAESFRMVHGSTRRGLCKRFPYCVYFVIEPEYVVVTAVLHVRRHQRMWKKRLKKR